MRSHHAVRFVGHRISVGPCTLTGIAARLSPVAPYIHFFLQLTAILMCSVIISYPRGIAATSTSDALCRQAALCTYALYFESDDNLDNLLSYRQRTYGPVSAGLLRGEMNCLTFALRNTHSRAGRCRGGRRISAH